MASSAPDGDDPTAAAVDRLLRLVDEAVLPDADRYTLDEVAAAAGVDVELTRRLWRALGFADPGPEDRIGGDADVAVLRVATETALTDAGVENMIRQTRVMSAAISRIAELWVDQVRACLDAADPALLAETERMTEDQDRVTYLLSYIHRRLYAAALRRELGSRSAGATTDRTVAFADLVGYTTLSERLGPLELSELIGTFEGLAHDRVAEVGGRLVKTIGDEVMFSTDDPADGVHVARRLLSEAPGLGLPDLRIGLDHGPVVPFEGDLFGSTVNRAARLVAEAPAGALAVTSTFAAAVPDREWLDLGVRDLKGVGSVEVVSLAVAAD
jgi:adenylate cyclase